MNIVLYNTIGLVMEEARSALLCEEGLDSFFCNTPIVTDELNWDLAESKSDGVI